MFEWLDRVRREYDADPGAEWRRLEARVQNRIEYLVTMHVLNRHLPRLDTGADAAVRVLDAGAGPGRYTIALAECGYTMTLLDLSAGSVAFACHQIRAAGSAVADRVEGVLVGSFIDLLPFPDAHFDAGLCLGGALSHVIDAGQRLQAVRELRRVARRHAPIVVSVGNRLASLRGAVQWPATWQAVVTEWNGGGLGALENGAPYYELMPEEVPALIEDAGLTLLRLYGCQGIAAHLPPANLEALMADPLRWPFWRERLLATCDHPSVIGVSCHLMAVARAP
jgi:SAM-dependent methyltransferase